MVVKGLMETAVWLTRLFQLFFAIILTGILSYMIHEFHHFGFSAPREVIVPEVFSVLAIIVTFFSILAVCFLGHVLQLVAAFLDFVIWVGYLASAGLLRHNFHVHSARNPLSNTLIFLRARVFESPRTGLNHALVKLLAALVIIQIILFFFTTLLSTFVAMRGGDRAPRRSRAAV